MFILPEGKEPAHFFWEVRWIPTKMKAIDARSGSDDAKLGVKLSKQLEFVAKSGWTAILQIMQIMFTVLWGAFLHPSRWKSVGETDGEWSSTGTIGDPCHPLSLFSVRISILKCRCVAGSNFWGVVKPWLGGGCPNPPSFSVGEAGQNLCLQKVLGLATEAETVSLNRALKKRNLVNCFQHSDASTPPF